MSNERGAPQDGGAPERAYTEWASRPLLVYLILLVIVNFARRFLCQQASFDSWQTGYFLAVGDRLEPIGGNARGRRRSRRRPSRAARRARGCTPRCRARRSGPRSSPSGSRTSSGTRRCSRARRGRRSRMSALSKSKWTSCRRPSRSISSISIAFIFVYSSTCGATSGFGGGGGAGGGVTGATGGGGGGGGGIFFLPQAPKENAVASARTMRIDFFISNPLSARRPPRRSGSAPASCRSEAKATPPP